MPKRARADAPEASSAKRTRTDTAGAAEDLGKLTVKKLKARLKKAVAEGELPASVDSAALARFVQTVQAGMSILARDGASRSELEGVAKTAMAGWDALTGGK